MSPSRKRVWVGAVSGLVLLALLWSLPPVRVEYHKWRLESVKARKTRLLGANPSGLDRFWLRISGTLVSGTELDRAMHKHEGALVGLGFLDREKLPGSMVAARPQTLETLAALQGECPWYHAETVSGTNLLVTACPRMMGEWRKRARELGW